MRKCDEIVAICAADLHLSSKKPACRSREEDWFAAMTRPLWELKNLQRKYTCPILLAGDVFHRYDPNPELINWAIRELPNIIIAIPGNHELPNHRLEDIKKSAFWTLVEIGKIRYSTEPMTIPEKVPLIIHPFPFGVPVRPLSNPHDLGLEIALVHDYVYSPSKGEAYPNVASSCRVDKFIKNCQGYDLVVTGDNHTPFEYENLFNCGTFMRRRADERNHKPSVGLIHADGHVHRYFLDISKDQFNEDEEEKILFDGLNISEFLKEMDHLVDNGLDFFDAANRLAQELRPAVKEVILKAIEGNKNGNS